MHKLKPVRVIGSRYFGGVRSQSDWDFIAEDTPEMRSFLQSTGWICTRIYDNKELSNTSFWRHTTHSAELFLCQSVRRRVWVREIIRWSKIFRFVRAKRSRMEVWWALERCVERLWVVWKEARKIEREHRRDRKRMRRGVPCEMSAREVRRDKSLTAKCLYARPDHTIERPFLRE